MVHGRTRLLRSFAAPFLPLLVVVGAIRPGWPRWSIVITHQKTSGRSALARPGPCLATGELLSVLRGAETGTIGRRLGIAEQKIV